MPNVRTMNKEKYGISKHRFLELYYYCMQYPEWKEQLDSLTDTVKSMDYATEIKGSSTGSATEHLAIKRNELRRKCELIEQTVNEAAPDLYQWLLEGVTRSYATYKYLKMCKNIPCGRDVYYDRRRKFYYLLSRKI